MLKVYLIRHAKSVLNDKGIKQGSDIDSELSPSGLEQARKLADRFEGRDIKAVYCSDLSRSYGTAKILSDKLGVAIIKDPNLRELKIGKWADGKSDPLQRWIEFYEAEKAKGIPREQIRPPGGENSWDHMERVKKFLDSIKEVNGEIIVVAHSGTNKVFIGTIKGTDPDEFYTFKQSNTCVNELIFNEGKWEVISINDVSHLEND